MSCEIICLEVHEILHTLVYHKDSIFVDRLLAFLEPTGDLDHHLAGYFEKILEMLFRKETECIISRINRGGVDLFQMFLNHIGNYSIMQIVQRLMLPHIPFSVLADPDSLSGEEKLATQCQWSFSEAFCNLLCSKMLEVGNIDVPSHISDLFITVIQLSPPDALVISNMCDSDCLERLLLAVFTPDAEQEQGTLDESMSSSSTSLAAISVLESLISRLSESLVPFDESQNPTQEEDYLRVVGITKICIDKLCHSMKKYFCDLHTHLRYYIEGPVGEIATQSKRSFPRLGHRGLQLIKLLESIVRLGEPEIEHEICSSSLLQVTVDLIFHFKLNSLLHLSVQRIVLMIVEKADAKRFGETDS